MKHLFLPLVIATGLALSANSTWAQGDLHDPTRPSSTLTTSAHAATVTAPDNLQMLLIGRQRSFAMMDGVIVKPGESFNQWQLVSIGRQSVVMRNAALTEEISIHPSVVKTVNQPSRSRP
jgi:hypothetical protein